jgi:3-oxoacyl-[acyl-carrier protein] reductase
MDLEGKTAVITGASKGIGKATALNLARRGCLVLGTCSSRANVHLFDAIANTARQHFAEPKEKRPRIIGIAADMYSPSLHLTLAGAVEHYFEGHLDIFVNNACEALPGEIGNMSPEEVDRSLVANVRNPVLIVDEFVKCNMFRKESRIIYISSVRSRQPWSMQLMYAAGKSAGESLCRTWSQAFGGREEKVGTVPSFVFVLLPRRLTRNSLHLWLVRPPMQ